MTVVIANTVLTLIYGLSRYLTAKFNHLICSNLQKSCFSKGEVGMHSESILETNYSARYFVYLHFKEVQRQNTGGTLVQSNQHYYTAAIML